MELISTYPFPGTESVFLCPTLTLGNEKKKPIFTLLRSQCVTPSVVGKTVLDFTHNSVGSAFFLSEWQSSPHQI